MVANAQTQAPVQALAVVVSAGVAVNGVIMSGGFEVLLDIAEVRQRGFGRVIVYIENGEIDRTDTTVSRKARRGNGRLMG